MKNKKSQISGQIFIYIFAMFVVGAIIYLGYTSVNTLIDTSKCAEVALFQNALKQDLKSSRGYGTQRAREYELPSEYTKVCFADIEKLQQDTNLVVGINPLISDSIKDGKANIFMMPRGACETEWSSLNGLGVENGYKCITAKGLLKLKLIGCGDKTIITDDLTKGVALCS